MIMSYGRAAPTFHVPSWQLSHVGSAIAHGGGSHDDLPATGGRGHSTHDTGRLLTLARKTIEYRSNVGIEARAPARRQGTGQGVVAAG